MKTKRFLSIVLTLAMLLGMFPSMSLTASAADNTKTITPGTDDAKTGTGTMTITLIIKGDPAATDFDVTLPTSLAYDGTAKTATAAAKSAVTGMGTITVEYYKGGTKVDSAVDVGDYTFKLKVADDGTHYNAGTVEKVDWKFTITKGTPTVTKPTAKTLTYNGSAQELVNAGSTNDGTLYYAVTTENTAPTDENLYTTSIPKATEAGTYYIWYKVKADDNHNDTEPNVLTVTIDEEIFVRYHSNGGSGNMSEQKVEKNIVTELKNIAFTREGYSFKEWNTKENGSGTSFADKAEVTLEVSLDLYAQWEESKDHNHLPLKEVSEVEPKCEEDGNKHYYECETCGKIFEDALGQVELTRDEVILKAIGHKWDDGEITKEATYDEEGVRTYTCLNDPSHTKEEIIPKKTRSSESDSGSSSSDNGSSGGSGSKNNSVSKQVIDVNGNVKSNLPSNHQVETGVPASDVGGRWANSADADTWTYTKSDGTLAKSEWMSLDYNGLRYWYYFDASGNMQTNWFDYNGKKFYLMPDKDGWRGRMATGWKKIDNKWYYFDITPGETQGSMYTAAITPDGHTVGADGAWNGVGMTPVGQE